MRDRIRKNIPDLGTVTFGTVTVGMIIEAHHVAEQANESDQPSAFTNFVLARMFVEPQKTSKDIARFPADTLVAVIEVAVDNLQIVEHFEATSEDLPVQERFFKAHLKHEQEVFEDLSTAIKQNLKMSTLGFQSTLDDLFRQIEQTPSLSRQIVEQFSKLWVPVPVVCFKPPTIDVASWARAFSISDSIVRLIQPAFEAQNLLAEQVRETLGGLHDSMQRISADLAAATISVQQTSSLGVFDNLKQLIQAHQDAVEAFKAAGWPIAPSMPSELIERVVSMHKRGKTRYISRTIMSHYQRDNQRCLIETVESWRSHPLFALRMRILDDILQAHCRRQYTLSVPALVPQIEGILNDYVFGNGLVAKLGKIQQVYEAAIGDVDKYEMSRWVIASTLLYQLQTNTYVFTDFEIELQRSVNTRRVSRHTVSHGVALKYDRPIHSLRNFLLLDAFSALRKL